MTAIESQAATANGRWASGAYRRAYAGGLTKVVGARPWLAS
jgi:hypothetical protein